STRTVPVCASTMAHSWHGAPHPHPTTTKWPAKFHRVRIVAPPNHGPETSGLGPSAELERAFRSSVDRLHPVRFERRPRAHICNRGAREHENTHKAHQRHHATHARQGPRSAARALIASPRLLRCEVWISLVSTPSRRLPFVATAPPKREPRAARQPGAKIDA